MCGGWKLRKYVEIGNDLVKQWRIEPRHADTPTNTMDKPLVREGARHVYTYLYDSLYVHMYGIHKDIE